MFAFLFSGTAHADSAPEACKVMMSKLMASSRIFLWDGHQWRIKDREKDADSTVLSAYGLSRRELDEKWPTLYEFSVATLLKAWRLNQAPEEMRANSIVECVRTFGE